MEVRKNTSIILASLSTLVTPTTKADISVHLQDKVTFPSISSEKELTELMREAYENGHFDRIRSGTQVLKSGDSGDSVTALQKILRSTGLSLEIDGKFGPETEKALKSFQQNNNLTVDGQFDVQELHALENLVINILSGAQAQGQQEAATIFLKKTESPFLVSGLFDLLYQKEPIQHDKRQPVSYSRVNEQIDTNKELRGYSRRAGDADPYIQIRCIELALRASSHMTLEDRATFLAIMCHESKLNPDAANPRSSAAGLFQIVRKTGIEVGLQPEESFEAEKNIAAAVRLFDEYLGYRSVQLAQGRERAEVLYALHHGGPAYDDISLKIARESVLPIHDEIVKILQGEDNQPLLQLVTNQS